MGTHLVDPSFVDSRQETKEFFAVLACHCACRRLTGRADSKSLRWCLHVQARMGMQTFSSYEFYRMWLIDRPTVGVVEN